MCHDICLLFLQSTSSLKVRCDAMTALKATSRQAVLARVVGTSLLTTLTAWMTAAREDEQVNLLDLVTDADSNRTSGLKLQESSVTTECCRLVLIVFALFGFRLSTVLLSDSSASFSGVGLASVCYISD